MNNTQKVQKALNDFQKGDLNSLVEILDENVNWVNPDAPELPFAVSVKGKNNVPSFFRILGETLDISLFDISGFAEQDNSVISWGNYNATVKNTGKKFTTPIVMVWSFNNDGKVENWQSHTNTLAQSKAF